jgi:hypothetical protein
MTLLRMAFLSLAFLTPAAAQVADANGLFTSHICGFQTKLPAGWKIRPSRSKKCFFTVLDPGRADDEGLDLIVRRGTLDQGANDLGFTKDSGKWMLQGEETVEAAQIESASWIGMQGTVGSRIYEKGHYSGFGDQTRALLFDRRQRIAEITCYSGEKRVAAFVKGFEFLSKSQ